MGSRDDIRPLGLGTPVTGAGAPRDASHTTDDVKDQAKNVASQARESANRLAGKAREQARQAVEERKGRAASSLDSLSGVLRDSAGRLRNEQSFFGDYAESAAERVERLARYLRESDTERFVRDAEQFARRRPEVFMGGMLVAGLLLGRFLKSSAPGAADNDFVYAGGGGAGNVGGTGSFGGTGTTGGVGGSGGFTGGGFGHEAGSTASTTGTRADVDSSWQPESGAYGGGTQRPNAPKLDNKRGTDLAPDDESGLGV